MTWLTETKWGAIAAVIIAMNLLSYHFGTLASKVALETQDAQESTAAATQARAIIKQDQLAETQHDEDLQAINLTVNRVAPPIWVSSGTACPAVPVPAPPSAPEHPSGGAADARPGERDIRAGITAFEQRYEIALANCRRLAAEWPTP